MPRARNSPSPKPCLERRSRQATPPKALVLRYLEAFGPASIADAQTWCGLGGLGTVFEQLRPKLRAFQDERGRELFDLPHAPRPDADEEAPVRFLPEWDNLLLSHADRSRVIADAHRPAITTANLRLPGTFLVDGFVAGTWVVDTEEESGHAGAAAVLAGEQERQDSTRRGRRVALCGSWNRTRPPSP